MENINARPVSQLNVIRALYLQFVKRWNLNVLKLVKALFVFDVKPIACTIAFKLIEYGDKTSTKSFNNLNSNEIERLCTDNSGSYFIQNCIKLFNSKDRTVWTKSLFDKLKVRPFKWWLLSFLWLLEFNEIFDSKGRLLNLCTNRNGSFIMDTIWSVSNLKQRTSIADELKASESQFRNDQ